MSQKYKSFSRGNSHSSDYSAGLPPGVKRIGYLKKLKKMKRRFFVLHMESNYGVARLEYYISEKKWRCGCQPRRCIELKSCLNISKKIHSKHNVIALYTKEDCFSVVCESPEELSLWLIDLTEVQKSIEVNENDRRYPLYDYLWQVEIDRHDWQYEGQLPLGPCRVALSSQSLFLLKMNPVNDNDYLEFPLMSIRRCGHSKDHFFIELGRSSVIGAGEIYMATEGTITAQNMHETVLNAMKSSKIREDGCPFPRPRSASTSENSNSVSTRRPVGYVAPPMIVSSASSCGLSNSRERCDSLPTRPNTICGGAHHNVLDGFSSPCTTSATTCRRLSSRPHSMYEWPSCKSPSARNANFNPSPLSSATTSTKSSKEDMDRTRHLSIGYCPLASDGSLLTSHSINEIPDDYLKMYANEEKKSSGSGNGAKSSTATAVSKLCDYMDMKSPCDRKSDFFKKPVVRPLTASENTTVKDGYMDMSPTGTTSKYASNNNSILKDAQCNFNNNVLPEKLFDLEKVIPKSHLAMISNDRNCNFLSPAASSSKTDPPSFPSAVSTCSSDPTCVQPPLPERTYRKGECKSAVGPPLPMRKPCAVIQNGKVNGVPLQSTVVGFHVEKRKTKATDFPDFEEQDVFYSHPLSNIQNKGLFSPDQGGSSSGKRTHPLSLPATAKNSSYKVPQKDENVDQSLQTRRSSATGDGHRNNPPMLEVSGGMVKNEYVNVEIGKGAPEQTSGKSFKSLPIPGSSDPSYTNIQFGKPFCPLPKPTMASADTSMFCGAKPERSFPFANPDVANDARSADVSQKVAPLPPKFRNIPNTLPAFRKQMSAPAAPLSLRPELPSPGRKSSCPVTASASMIRPTMVASPMRPLHLQGAAPAGHLRVSTSRSPDHSSVSSISSASDEISSAHSSPKALVAPQSFCQYENVSIPQKTSDSRPSSTSGEEKELNYAMLDLAPSLDAPRSPTGSQRAPQGVAAPQEESLPYAEIDFTKSEGLKNISGSIRDGRL